MAALRNSRPDPEWLKRAAEIRKQLALARFGEKGAVFAQFSKETRYAISSLKREVAAAEFIERMDRDDPELSADLRELGSNAVAEISRLFTDHPQIARAKARAAATGSISEADVARARLAAEANSPPRTGRRRSREFLQFLADEGHKYGIQDTRRPRVRGALMEFRMRDWQTGCAVFDASSGDNIDRVDRHLAMLLFYDWLVVGLNDKRVPFVWTRRLYEMRHRRDSVLLFTRTAAGFQQADHI